MPSLPHIRNVLNAIGTSGPRDQGRDNGDQQAAGSATSIPYILSGVLVPPCGLLLDLPPFRSGPWALITSNVLMIICHLLFLWKKGPILPLCLLGIAYALYGVAFWAALARCLLFIVESPPSAISHVPDAAQYLPPGSEHESLLCQDQTPNSLTAEEEPVENERAKIIADKGLITLGYGIMTSLLNLCTALVPVSLAGAENMAGFSGVEIVFLGLTTVGCIASIQLAQGWNY